MPFLLCLMLTPLDSGVDSNGIDIMGRVTGGDSNPLVGATVMITGTSFGAMSDSNGEYVIEDHSATDSISLNARMLTFSPVDTVLAVRRFYLNGQVRFDNVTY